MQIYSDFNVRNTNIFMHFENRFFIKFQIGTYKYMYNIAGLQNPDDEFGGLKLP